MTAFVNAFHSALKPRSPDYRVCRPSTSTITCSVTPLSQPQYPHRVSRAVVWFREGDLRLQDHPGLEAACEHTSTALAHLLVCTPTTSDATLAAATRLQNDLTARGSHLSVRFAHDEADAVIAFLQEYEAERVHVRKDVETNARSIVERVERAVNGHADVDTWVADLREWDGLSESELADVPDRFPSFLRWPLRRRAPILASTSDFEPQRIVPSPGIDNDPPDMIETVSTNVHDSALLPFWSQQFSARFQSDIALTRALQASSDSEKFGEALLLDFLKTAERYEQPDFARSLSEIFRQGTLSPRRIRQIVLEFERQNGRVIPPFFREAAKTVLNVLDAQEFSTLLARRDVKQRRTVDGSHEAKFWRWNGFLIRYVEEGRESEGALRGTPPLLFVHGVGASSFHFGKSISLLKDRFHVFAIDLIGFGRSEKPPMQYTNSVWEALVWDFVRDIIGQPVYVAGNSIGGYLACAFGTDAYEKTCAGICLVNSAGRVSENVTPGGSTDARDRIQYWFKKWRWTRMLAGRLLLRYLQGRIVKTLNSVYPIHPVKEDSYLPEEILRASLDYGAADVLASALIMPVARSLERLLSSYDGPLLVFNGVLDPLGNVKLRTETLRKLYPAATVATVQAGHCPHDEVAEEFSEAVSNWVVSNELKVRSPQADLSTIKTR